MPGARGRRWARHGLTVAAAGLAALALLGSAGAATIEGTPGPDRLVGTASPDVLTGLGGADRLEGLAGADVLDGGEGRDQLFGGPGNDRLAAEEDGARDAVSCGAGHDTVTAELADQVASDCETVSRQLSRDPFDGYDGQHETEVEPDSFAFGSTIVTVFQVGRSNSGGAVTNGFATSRDVGRTWRAGHLPGLTFASTPPGSFQGASDPVVGYDARHGYWLAASIAFTSGAGTAIAVSRSRDGLVWGSPVTAVSSGPESPDKEWVACDNWSSSRFRGTCYLAYYDLVRGVIAVRTSRDAGATWSAAVETAGTGRTLAIVNGAQPVVRKDGTLVILYSVFGSTLSDIDEIAAVRSTNGGASFGPPTRVADLQNEEVSGLRVPPFTSAEVAGDGTIWAVWSDCRFRPECDQNGIVLTSSRNGVTWTRPVRVPTGNSTVPYAYVLPGLGVDITTGGNRTRLGIVYHAVPQAGGCGSTLCGGIDVSFVGSVDGGRTWSTPVRLTTRPMPLEWIADGGIGAILGDYVSTSWAGGRPIPVFALASEPVFGALRQAIFAATSIDGFRPARTSR